MDGLIPDAEAWLEPLGYSVHHRAPNGRYVAFVKSGGSPVIECWEDESGTRGCRMNWMGLKLFMHIGTGDMQYRHPDIERKVKVMEHYIAACTSNPPF